MSSKFSSPFLAKSPLNQNGEKDEIRDASEILGDQPGYNKKTNTVMQAGSANIPSRNKAATGAAAVAAGLTTLGTFAYNSIKNKLTKKPKGQRRGDLGYQRFLDKEKFDKISDVAKKIKK